MISGVPLHHIYIVGDATREPDRIAYLNSYFESEDLSEHVSYFQPTYKTTLTDKDFQKYMPINCTVSGREMSAAELSIFLNMFFLFEKILKEWIDDREKYICVFESDVIFEGSFRNYLQGLTCFLSDVHPECVSIGSGCDLIHDTINTDDLNFQIYPSSIVRCMDSFLFTYDGIRKFTDYIRKWFAEGKSINQPIDNFFETFLKLEQKDEPYTQYWVWPSITRQGSQYGTYSSTIQPF
jgi:GR25 family glycosyltransferase involved in LPS biosynthesis